MHFAEPKAPPLFWSQITHVYFNEEHKKCFLFFFQIMLNKLPLLLRGRFTVLRSSPSSLLTKHINYVTWETVSDANCYSVILFNFFNTALVHQSHTLFNSDSFKDSKKQTNKQTKWVPLFPLPLGLSAVTWESGKMDDSPDGGTNGPYSAEQTRRGGKWRCAVGRDELQLWNRTLIPLLTFFRPASLFSFSLFGEKKKERE